MEQGGIARAGYLLLGGTMVGGAAVGQGQIPNLTAQKQDGGQLFRSGMNIGKDMIGTMSNTLIFAFAGNALATMMSLTAYGVQSAQLFLRQTG